MTTAQPDSFGSVLIPTVASWRPSCSFSTAGKLGVQPELFVVAIGDDDRIVGTVMAGYDGHRGWMNYLAARPGVRGTGVGRALVEHVEEALHALGCPKVSIQVRSSNAQVVAFYEHLGYSVDDTIDLGRRLIAD